jgi:glycosyltransferase involved in cell wall biosynthesis
LLAKENKILFIEYPFTVKDMITKCFGKGRAPVYRMLGLRKRMAIRNTDHDTKVYQLILPPLLPVEFIKVDWLYKFLLKFNAYIYARSVKRALKKLKMNTPICINAYNAIYGNLLVGKVKEKLHIFYCYDGPDTGRYGKRAIASHHSFAKKVDGVIVTSEFLANSMKGFNEEIHVVKNGVDFKIFNPMAKSEPNSSNGLKKKVGYIGSLDYRFDLDTIEYAVKTLPDYDFEFVGELMNKTIKQCLSKYPNVQFKSPVQPHQVPALLRGCDVGLIPYLCNEYTMNIYPLKINEYLSIGVPVVLTSFAMLPEFNRIVTFTSDKVSFCKAIKNEVQKDNSERIKKRIEFAEGNSWENRTERFKNIIDLLLIKKRY